jgi:hypothetical protein
VGDGCNLVVEPLQDTGWVLFTAQKGTLARPHVSILLSFVALAQCQLACTQSCGGHAYDGLGPLLIDEVWEHKDTRVMADHLHENCQLLRPQQMWEQVCTSMLVLHGLWGQAFRSRASSSRESMLLRRGMPVFFYVLRYSLLAFGPLCEIHVTVHLCTRCQKHVTQPIA